ncbi:MAG TPA: hypothetical protein VFK73_01265, partial [Paludibacter sp.]|nr:hypothetical protein [Paludibacter sp.]
MVSAQAIGDYRSSFDGNWAAASSWETYNGILWVPATTYPGQVGGNYSVSIQAANTITIPGTGITTNPMGTVTISGKLVLIGDNAKVNYNLNTLMVIVTPGLTPYATIEFNNKSALVLPTDAVLQVWAGGLSGACNNNQEIHIGTIPFANCNGAPGSIFTFAELMAAGGTLNATEVAPPRTCLGDPVSLVGGYTGAIGTPVTYKWTSTGPAPLVFFPSSTDKTPTINPTVPGLYTVSLTVSTIKGTILYSNTDKVTLVVLPTSSDNFRTICSSQLPYVWDGLTFTSAGSQSITGLKNILGCDSTANLNLSLNPPSSATITGKTLACLNSAEPRITFTGMGGTAPYTFNYNINNGFSQSVTTTNGDTISVLAPTGTAGVFDYNLISVTDAKSCSQAETGKLSITVLAASSTRDSIVCASQVPFVWNNQIFTTSGTKTETLKNVLGCDSTATLNLTVLAASSKKDSVVCASQIPFVWNGQTFSSSSSKTVTLKNILGCDSLVTLNLTVLSASSKRDSIVCTSQVPFIWNNLTFTTTGSQTAILKNILGCDSLATLNLTVLAANSIRDSIVCAAQVPFAWNNQIFSASGTKTETLKNILGCDSVATLNLTVLAASSTRDSVVCASQVPFVWNSQTFTTSGTKTVTLKNILGCDSVATLNLTVLAASSKRDSIVCVSQVPFIWNSQTFSASGSKTVTVKNILGCDSVATLNLTVLAASSIRDSIVCTSQVPFAWNNQIFSASGTKTETLKNILGCDSVATLNLTVLAASSVQNKTICTTQLPYNWNGTTFTKSGSKTVTLKNILGCDSVATLNLTVLAATSKRDSIVCASQVPFAWNNLTFSASGSKTVTLKNILGCDSVATLNLTVLAASSIRDSIVCTSQ